MTTKLTKRGRNVVVGTVVLLTAGAAMFVPVQADNATVPRGWEPVNSFLADALAEGGAPDATTRNWEACMVKYRKNSTAVRCPDGYREKWSNIEGP